MLLVPACAGANSGVRSSTEKVPPSEKRGRTQAEEGPAKPRLEPIQSDAPPGMPPEEEVPEWLKKKPAGDRSADAFHERMAEEHRQILQYFDDMAARIDFTNGIDASEAEFIAGAYFSMAFGACGGPDKPRDGGAEWLMHPRIGVSGQPLSDFIRVDKRTGAVRYGSGPTTEAKAAIEFERGLLQKSVERYSKRGSSQ